MKSIRILLILLTLVPLQSAHAVVYSGVNPQAIGPVLVSYEDGARDGCWTNISEVDSYAKQKLSIRGYTVATSPEEAAYFFHIYVQALRFPGMKECVGYISVELFTRLDLDGVRGRHTVGQRGAVFINAIDGNNYVFGIIDDLVDEM